jgi:hypothetical protein
MDMDIDELLNLERRGWDALCEGTGSRFYGELMTEHGLMVLAHGLALDREAVIVSLDDAPAWDAYAIDEPRLVGIDADSAALVYTGRASRGDEAPFVALMSSVYTRRDGRWRLALYQQTPIPAG